MLLEAVVVFLAVAFVPPLLFLLWLRAHETVEREPWGQLLRVFAAGGVLGVLLALALEVVADLHLRRPYELLASAVPYAVFTAVVVAPVAEELAKALCVLVARDPHPQAHDGLVYGAAAGFGFAATENLLYEGAAFAVGGVGAWAATAAVRSVAAVLLHASASAWAGYGILRWRAGEAPAWTVAPWLLLAMALHAAYNALASVGILAALALAVVLSLVAFRRVRRRVLRHDAAAR